MKIKRRILSAVTALFTATALFSCAPAPSDPLAYQDRAAEVTGTLYSDTGTFSFIMTLPEMKAPGERRDAEILLTSPETLSGVKVSVFGQTTKIGSGETELPVSPAAAGRWSDIIGLFSLDGGRVTSVTEDDNGVVVGVGDAPERVLVSFRAGEELPSRIETEDGELSLVIEKFIITDQTTTEGTGKDGGH